MSTSPSDHDPFASPQSIGSDFGYVADPLRRPSGAVTAVAVLNYVMGVLNFGCGGILAGSGILIWRSFATMAKDFEVDWREGIGDVFGSVIAGVIVAFGILMVVVALLALLAGYGVQKRRQWGRYLTIVLAALSGLVALLSAINLSPFAFLFGVYAIYVLVILLQRKYAEEFA